MAGVDGGDTKKGGKTPGFDASSAEAYLIRDPETFAINIARALENLGKAASNGSPRANAVRFPTPAPIR